MSTRGSENSIKEECINILPYIKAISEGRLVEYKMFYGFEWHKPLDIRHFISVFQDPSYQFRINDKIVED